MARAEIASKSGRSTTRNVAQAQAVLASSCGENASHLLLA
eukprot:CAMPEP_0204020320 /NCGR_PEP_ID=MMETSP0360-20130528/29346_1 /ASSEMBLY_ACC=CAM_ASM_000342 /TAXON_ID=268821 /ORGANISM="Scrippsiella Hangoei, Strain SHTV-5" /LENGTH=39 /DNA_ID= /DNA_START= /DNA_END= /DNA_ORIENTATION=